MEYPPMVLRMEEQNPHLTIEQVREHYIRQFPNLPFVRPDMRWYQETMEHWVDGQMEIWHRHLQKNGKQYIVFFEPDVPEAPPIE